MSGVQPPLSLRPHHGLCIPHFAGKGYSEAFSQNMRLVISRLQAAPGQLVRLQANVDAVCAACPHNRQGACEASEKVARYDAACLALCGLRDGQVLPWRAFAQRVRQNILVPGKLAEVCRGCQWLSFCLAANGAD